MDNCLSLNAGAEFVVRRKFGRAIDKAEALEILKDARGRGLVQIADNVLNSPTYICNCCGCCCGQLEGINRGGLTAVNPSNFEPKSDAAICSGCSRCARACPIGAIEMKAVRAQGSRKNDLVPRVDLGRCIGCGVCGSACVKHAMRMARRKTKSYVPLNSVEKAVRMALEKGRLADLLFEQGQGLGSRFLHQAFKALMALPLAERVLASEQVQSRFVRAALRMVKDPTSR
jgi:Pyruvate/2-oxoacid:ferredoxin oxidoreductase delta subunit